MIWGVIYNIILLGCCLYAWALGERPEKAGAALFFSASMATWAVKAVFGSSYYTGFMTPVFVVDNLLLLLLIVLALRVNRYWPLWAAGFHLANLITHIAVLTNAATAPMAYANAVVLWGYAVLFALVGGTWLEVHRRRRITALEKSSFT